MRNLNIYADMKSARMVEMVNMFPELRNTILTRLGYRAKDILRDEFTTEKSQTTVYYGPRSVTKSRRGNRWLAGYRTMNNYQKIRLTSFTMNLFEYDATWKSGRRRIGRHALEKTGYMLSPEVMAIADKATEDVLKNVRG